MQHPTPEFAVGQSVRVIVNERNRTTRTGRVREVIWHFKLTRWTFFLEEDGKRVSKRYFADDLVAEPFHGLTESPNPPEQAPARG